jgi:mRNA-degrading endonuclease toxin of MazEF toxin-antitoxin module
LVRPNIPAAGEIWWLELVPAAGREQRGRHPGLVLSDFRFNRARGFAYFAPITTVGNASRSNGLAVSLTGAGTGVTGVTQLDQVKSMDWRTRNGENSGDVLPEALFSDVLERFGPIFGLGLFEDDPPTAT